MKTRKRKLFVDARWLAQPGQGTCTYFHEIYSRLVKREVPELELIFGVVKGHIPSFINPGTQIIEYGSDRLEWRLFKLGQKINKIKPDFVHFQYLLPFGLNSSIHKIVVLHDVIFLENPEFFTANYRLSRKFLFGISARKADTLLTISDLSCQQIEKHLGIPRKQIQVIPLGAGSRLKLLEQEPITSLVGQSYFLTVGRHEPRKNYSRLIEAYRNSGLWTNHGVKLVIAGWLAKGFLESKLLDGEGVELITECNDSQLAWLYRNANSFIFPSVAEGYGLPLAEALEFKLPCAVSRTYPIDSLRDACLATFDPYSVSEITNSMRILFENNAAQSHSNTSVPTWDDHVDRFLEILLSTPLQLSTL